MRISKIDTSKPIRVQVGDVTVLIIKVGDRSARLGIAAPGEVPIEISHIDDYRPQGRGG